MASPYTPIVGVLAYIMSPDREQVLLIHRDRRPGDHHLGKYNGLGGKLRPNEDVLACLHREVREESGLAVEAATLRGTINWTGFGPDGEDWLGFIFRVDRFRGEPFAACDEGSLAWHPLAALHTLPMWEGDRHFLPLVFDDDPRAFHGHMPYRDGRPLSWRYHRL